MSRVRTKSNFTEMKLNQHLKDWKQIVSCRFPDLSLPQVNGLATWSFGMVMTQSSSLSRVSTLIAKINAESENTVRQRLKEWYKSGTALAHSLAPFVGARSLAKTRPGNKRASIEVESCFGSLLKWVINLLPQSNRELPMAIDATNIGQNFTVLSINVLYRRCAIPVASESGQRNRKRKLETALARTISSFKRYCATTLLSCSKCRQRNGVRIGCIKKLRV